MHLQITLDGITREYHVDEDDVYNEDWNEKIHDILDTIIKNK